MIHSEEKIIVEFNKTANNENINCNFRFCEKCKIAKDIEQFKSICNKNKKYNKLCRRCLNIVGAYKNRYILFNKNTLKKSFKE